ncbi:MAG: LCP family protein [Clostridiales bacterium]|nr:LCP family protein [Clostridiales bacterium]
MKEKTTYKKPKKRRSKKSKIIIIFCILLAIIIVPITTLFIVTNKYLGYLDYTPIDEYPELEINPDYRKDAPIVIPEDDTEKIEIFNKADDAIEENVKDTFIFDDSNVTNILLVGCDYGSISKYYPRSDAMLIASINNVAKTIKYLSLSRATYVSIKGHGNMRLNAAYEFGGPKLLVETIESNYKIKIDNYIAVDFTGFSKLVDIMGGVDITLTEAEFEVLAPELEKSGIDHSKGPGDYHLDGRCALAYARLREIDSDRQRTQRQRNIMKQLTGNAKNMNLAQLRAAATKIFPLVKTGFKKSEIFSEIVKAPDYITYRVSEAIVPRKGTNLVTVNGTEVLIYDWNEVRADIREQIYAGINT